MDQKFVNEKPLILVVEDDEPTGDILDIVIAEETHFCSLWVPCAQDALQLLKTKRPQLFILDYLLPDMTGIELYDYLQTRPEFSQIPTLLMSASKPVEEIEARDVVLLAKPFDLDEFLMTIHRLMEHSLTLV